MQAKVTKTNTDMASFSPTLPSFRDPAGSVELRPDGTYRRINPPFESDVLALLSLPTITRWVNEGRFINSEVVQAEDVETLTLRHPRISFPSYPWEWPPSQWLKAAELTLGLCSDLLQEGWSLKDVTPLNVLFRGMPPVFVDVLSVEGVDPKNSLWSAYGQFVRTFLLPMLACSQLGWPLQATLTRRDGYEPEEIYSALPWLRRIREPAFLAVTLPSLLSGIARHSEVLPRRISTDPEIAQQTILKLLKKLLAQMLSAMPPYRGSMWSSYTDTSNHYSEEDNLNKKNFISAALTACNPENVLDIGCNTGAYSIMTATMGADVVAIDTDIHALEKLCSTDQCTGKNILPLAVDFARPTPSVGWENRECLFFLSRCEGHFDTVLMLAVIHHLMLGSQIPLDHIASLTSRLTKRNLIVEWIPPTDKKFKEILRGRDDIYAHITESAFRESFGRYFNIASQTSLSNGRLLIHLLRRSLWRYTCGK